MNPAATTNRVLDARRVDKSFAIAGERRRVLTSVDLTIDRGEVVVVAGRSGSGKTTLLTLVAGLDHPDSGTIRLFDGTSQPDACAWHDVAILPQSLGLLAELTVVENIVLPMRLSRLDGGHVDPHDLMTELGIDHLAGRRPSEISLGEQQRVALARAAILRPRLLLADEPISHQNHEFAHTMMSFVRALADAGTACLLATHNDIAFEIADRIVEMADGAVVGTRS